MKTGGAVALVNGKGNRGGSKDGKERSNMKIGKHQ